MVHIPRQVEAYTALWIEIPNITTGLVYQNVEAYTALWIEIVQH